MLKLILWHTPLEAVVAVDVVVVAVVVDVVTIVLVVDVIVVVLGVVVGTTVVVVDVAAVSLTRMESLSMSKPVTFEAVLFKTFLISALFGTDVFTNRSSTVLMTDPCLKLTTSKETKEEGNANM